MYLNEIDFNKDYIVSKINTKNKVRLYDIGLTPSSLIKLLYVSPSKRIKAYLIRDSIIAIRDSDANKIEVLHD